MIGVIVHATLPDPSLVLLSAGGVEVGIAPRLAGRIVLFRRTGGPNALLADPATWGPGERTPGLTAGWDFKPYNGHIVWVGPQNEWWMHQAFSAEKRDRKDNWPPDPWGEYAPFHVERHSATEAVLAGPASPISGLMLRKEVRIEPDGTVRVTVTARNTRTEPVRWDLWSNTRVPGTHRVYVPVEQDTAIRVERASSSPFTQTGLNDTVVNGWYTLLADEPIPADKSARVTKAYLAPARGIIAAVGDGQLFVKRFAVTPAARMAPGQSPVELFQMVNRDPALNLLELEAHGPYTALAPGRTMTFEEVWTLTAAPDAADPASAAALLNRLEAPAAGR